MKYAILKEDTPYVKQIIEINGVTPNTNWILVPENLEDPPSENYILNSFTWTWEEYIPETNISLLSQEVKLKRNTLLQKSDWTQLPDIEQNIQLKWQPYRQALRDITLQEGFPTDVVWPERPQ